MRKLFMPIPIIIATLLLPTGQASARDASAAVALGVLAGAVVGAAVTNYAYAPQPQPNVVYVEPAPVVRYYSPPPVVYAPPPQVVYVQPSYYYNYPTYYRRRY